MVCLLVDLIGASLAGDAVHGAAVRVRNDATFVYGIFSSGSGVPRAAQVVRRARRGKRAGAPGTSAACGGSPQGGGEGRASARRPKVLRRLEQLETWNKWEETQQGLDFNLALTSNY
jgi:hypothetical protein